MTTDEECEKLRSLGAKAGAFVAKKHAAYGSAYAKVAACMALLVPDGPKPAQYAAFTIVTRILEKVSRYFTAPDAFGESPLGDVIGHAFCLGLIYGVDFKGVDHPDDGRAAALARCYALALDAERRALDAGEASPELRGKLAALAAALSEVVGEPSAEGARRGGTFGAEGGREGRE